MPQPTATTVAKSPSVTALMAVVAGTSVLTPDGEMPVEMVQPGDRILTRAGVRRLAQVEISVVRNARVVRISHGTLGIDCPDVDVTVSAAQQILVRDWRATAMAGKNPALIAACDLVDGDYIRAETVAEARFFSLVFEQDAVIYAGGLEMACPARVMA